jgi:RNA polymerase sporulation-specific sigma factor
LFGSAASLLEMMRDLLFLVSYVEKGNYFPQPLNSDEEAKVIERHLHGEAEARNILIERNLRLVVHVAKKYHGCGKEMDDLISIGTIGLIKAVNTYNRKKGTQLATYAARCIDNEILMTIRSAKKEKNEVYMQEPIGIDKEGNEISLTDVLGTNQDEVLDKVDLKIQLEKLDHLIDRVLDDREKRVILFRYGIRNCKRMTQREIGKLLGISRSYVSRIEKKAIETLNDNLSAMDGIAIL